MKKFIYQGLIYLVLCTLLVQHVQTRKIEGRIISGTAAVPGQFPWQVILKRDETDDLLCGGSIISDSWVLTAGHCTYGHSSLYLVFGTIQLDNDDNTMTATQMFIHPNYNPKTLNNDVSLIKLPTPLIFSNTIQPIQLVPSSSASFQGSTAVIAGFGLIDDEYLDYSSTLLWAQVVVINNSDCVSIFGSAVILDSTICAKGIKGTNQSICSGDSGGPLIIQNSNGVWMQIGINSFVAEDKCGQGYPSAYARLTSFLDYISSTTGLTLS